MSETKPFKHLTGLTTFETVWGAPCTPQMAIILSARAAILDKKNVTCSSLAEYAELKDEFLGSQLDADSTKFLSMDRDHPDYKNAFNKITSMVANNCTKGLRQAWEHGTVIALQDYEASPDSVAKISLSCVQRLADTALIGCFSNDRTLTAKQIELFLYANFGHRLWPVYRNNTVSATNAAGDLKSKDKVDHLDFVIADPQLPPGLARMSRFAILLGGNDPIYDLSINQKGARYVVSRPKKTDLTLIPSRLGDVIQTEMHDKLAASN